MRRRGAASGHVPGRTRRLRCRRVARRAGFAGGHHAGRTVGIFARVAEARRVDAGA